MNIRHSIVLALLLLVVGTMACSPSWDRYRPSDGTWSAMMPGDPVIETDFEQLGGGISYTMTTYRATPMFGLLGKEFSVMVIEYNDPQGNMAFDWDAAKEGARGGVRGEGATIIGEKDVEIAGFDGWELTAEVQDQTEIMRMFYNGELKMYSVNVAFKKGKDIQDEIDKFFNSFTISGS